MKKFLIPLLCISSVSALASESKCDYNSDVNTEFLGTIVSSKNYSQKAYPHIEDTRKCIVKIDVNINEVWYPTSGQYIFGPDMTEVDACKRAEVRAKESILREVVPEKLNRTMNQNCAVTVRTVPVNKVPEETTKDKIIWFKPKTKPVQTNLNNNSQWAESGWKSVYTPVTSGCHATERSVGIVHGRKTLVYKEVCKVK